MKTVLFEVNKHTGIMSNDTVVVYDSFDYINWYHNNTDYTLLFSSNNADKMYKSIKDLLNDTDGLEICSNVIPVGSIEFVESVLGKQIHAINIPVELRDRRFTQRDIIETSSNEIGYYLDKYSKLFIKDALHCKKYEPRIISKTSKDDLPQVVFASEVIDIVAEWRVFVYNRRIIDCRRYIGNYTDKFDEKTLKNMVITWKNSPKAYTLDIALTSSGETVVIEAHNFISCGLYGFEDLSKIGYMIEAAYNQERAMRGSVKQ